MLPDTCVRSSILPALLIPARVPRERVFVGDGCDEETTGAETTHDLPPPVDGAPFMSSNVLAWDREGLEGRGFQGFVPFRRLPYEAVPAGAGVYVVYRTETSPPAFLDRSCGGHFKGKDPTESQGVLAGAWVPGAQVMNIGKVGAAAGSGRGLRKRLDEYRRFGEGRPVGHWGGRYIWQLSDSAELLVAWRTTPGDDPREVERALIAEFVLAYGRRPFANLRD